jgi:hypothetical protein
MNKNLPKSVKYIFPSSKYQTGVWFLRERDRHLPFTSVGSMDIDLADTNIVKLLAQPTKQTYESPASDQCIPGIRKEPRLRILSLPVISKAKNSLRCCRKLTKGSCPDSMDVCIMVSSEEGTIELRVFGEVR